MRAHTPRTRQSQSAPRFNAASGSTLDRHTRGLMESRFRTDFSMVRVHTGTEAERAAGALSAKAFTAGPNIVFGTGQYAPESDRGRGLLAHELTHVVQQRGGVAAPDRISTPGDSDERTASAALSRVAEGRHPGPLPPAAAALQRDPLSAPSFNLFNPPVLIQSQAETAMESFLGQIWEKQAKGLRPLRLSPALLEGLRLVFPFGPPVGAISEWETPRALMDQIRPKLPKSIEPAVQNVLDTLPKQEKALPAGGFKADADPATPKFGGPAAGMPPGPPDPRKPPEKGKGEDEAAKEALKAAAEMFRKTKLGQELEKFGKEYVLSKKGIPLVAIIAAGTIAFVTANDVSIPSTPDIPVADGITLKLDISAKPSELPPLLRELVHGQSDQIHPERKVGVQTTFTFEALGDFAVSVGHFFAEAGRWIGKGVVGAGTVIGKAASSALPEILATLGGAALGAGLGALAGGGVGALIGMGIGAGVGLGAALIKRLVSD